MGMMFPLLVGCRLMFTAVIMVDITVVKHSVCVRGKAIFAVCATTVSVRDYCCISRSQTVLEIPFDS